MRLDLAVRECKVIVGEELVEASIGVAEGKVVRVAKDPNLPKAEVEVKAKGLIALPGMVDLHVHLREPGFTWKEDFYTGTSAAACGGVTTVADMPNTEPPTVTLSRLKEKARLAKSKAVVDYVLYAGASPRHLGELEAMVREGAGGIKVYMATHSPELLVPRKQLGRVFMEASRIGALCLLHGEALEEVEEALRSLPQGFKDPLLYAKARGPRIEAKGVKAALKKAAESGVRLHLCHLSSAGSLKALLEAKRRGLKVTAETCPHYLLLTLNDLRRLKAYAKVDPPLRGWRHRRALWEALRRGLIDALATDHAPHSREEREAAWRGYLEAPSGFAGVEIALPLMLTCVAQGLLSLSKLVELYSENPSRILGLHPVKGSLSGGADADIALVSLSKEWRIKAEKLHSKCPETPFEGRAVKGAVEATIVRGEVVAEEGEVKVKPGYGEMVRPGGRML
ncbi:MAG: allantoinase AllB [Thermoprotei archaeon]|nr:MAG: allantoinase AllB [Thermoprotei archaeon]